MRRLDAFVLRGFLPVFLIVQAVFAGLAAVTVSGISVGSMLLGTVIAGFAAGIFNAGTSLTRGEIVALRAAGASLARIGAGPTVVTAVVALGLLALGAVSDPHHGIGAQTYRVSLALAAVLATAAALPITIAFAHLRHADVFGVAALALLGYMLVLGAGALAGTYGGVLGGFWSLVLPDALLAYATHALFRRATFPL